jgi:hypothetical protein
MGFMVHLQSGVLRVSLTTDGPGPSLGYPNITTNRSCLYSPRMDEAIALCLPVGPVDRISTTLQESMQKY